MKQVNNFAIEISQMLIIDSNKLGYIDLLELNSCLGFLKKKFAHKTRKKLSMYLSHLSSNRISKSVYLFRVFFIKSLTLHVPNSGR